MVTSELWSSHDCDAWQRALDAYDTHLHASERLPTLDTFVRVELPALLHVQGHITRDQIVRVIEWKMKRGKFRARNLWLATQNTPADVASTSAQAIARIPDERQPIAMLCGLKGVGPATASAVLAALRPDLYPFFDEDVAAQIPALGEIRFTLPYYLRYAAALRERAAALRAECHEKWHAHAVGLALWSASRIDKDIGPLGPSASD